MLTYRSMHTIFIALLIVIFPWPAKVSGERDAPLVSVEVYYETLCPDSIDFILNQLDPTFQNVSVILNITLVPFGIATESKKEGKWIFTCQHGPRECKANIIQTCILHLLPEIRRSSKALDLIKCMEKSEDPSSSGGKCAKQVKVNFGPIANCATGKQGNHLQHEMAILTFNLNPKLTWVPWIVLNGVHTDDIQKRASTDLLGLVCDTYQGPKPTGCPTLNRTVR